MSKLSDSGITVDENGNILRGMPLVTTVGSQSRGGNTPPPDFKRFGDRVCRGIYKLESAAGGRDTLRAVHCRQGDPNGKQGEVIVTRSPPANVREQPDEEALYNTAVKLLNEWLPVIREVAYSGMQHADCVLKREDTNGPMWPQLTFRCDLTRA